MLHSLLHSRDTKNAFPGSSCYPRAATKDGGQVLSSIAQHMKSKKARMMEIEKKLKGTY